MKLHDGVITLIVETEGVKTFIAKAGRESYGQWWIALLRCNICLFNARIHRISSFCKLDLNKSSLCISSLVSVQRALTLATLTSMCIFLENSSIRALIPAKIEFLKVIILSKILISMLIFYAFSSLIYFSSLGTFCLFIIRSLEYHKAQRCKLRMSSC